MRSDHLCISHVSYQKSQELNYTCKKLAKNVYTGVQINVFGKNNILATVLTVLTKAQRHFTKDKIRVRVRD